MRQLVEQTIEAIRPALQADGGDMFFRDVDEDTGVVTVSSSAPAAPALPPP